MDRTPLDDEALRAALGDRWSRIETVAETASTNADLLARPDAADRTLLAADFQNAGRGRFDRVWTSPPRAGMTASFLFRPAAPLGRWGWLPLLAGVAVCEAVAELGVPEARLKWPNDVQVDGDKLAGILAQSADGAVVVGIGANVSTAADELPTGVPATSLALAGAEVTPTDLVIAVARRLDARVAQWDDCGGDAGACGLAAAYRQRCVTLGQPVRVSFGDGSEPLVGTARDVDEAGHLIVSGEAGDRVVTAGDVEHLRAGIR